MDSGICRYATGSGVPRGRIGSNAAAPKVIVRSGRELFVRSAPFAAICAVLLTVSATAHADALITTTAKDNTLYQEPDGLLSNGAGQYMFAGRTAASGVRRAVMAFDLSSIPAGSTIESVSLRLHMSRTTSGTVSMRLHRLLRDWGEGASDAGEPGGGGSGAEAGDATWVHTFYDTDRWNTPGGDYVTTPSAQTNVGGVNYYIWTGAGMVADVQNWVDGHATNAGWILIGPELSRSAKRFETRENPFQAYRPQLTVIYTPIPEAAPIASLAAACLLVMRRRVAGGRAAC